jgi:hypothetical protein
VGRAEIERIGLRFERLKLDKSPLEPLPPSSKRRPDEDGTGGGGGESVWFDDGVFDDRAVETITMVQHQFRHKRTRKAASVIGAPGTIRYSGTVGLCNSIAQMAVCAGHRYREKQRNRRQQQNDAAALVIQGYARAYMENANRAQQKVPGEGGARDNYGLRKHAAGRWPR